ncbi:uncharacterized protein LOC125490756 [Plutella xylostella]|uniref:uncharacterized protein LOC125490756 n=1 Tax=Plutella xylostella TaxID=51655 RepID=UPI0020323BE5|nr:uncharacterized protein LOC125490756 [Plutella xylostella]
MSQSILNESSPYGLGTPHSFDHLQCGQVWFDSDVEEVRPSSPERTIAKKKSVAARQSRKRRAEDDTTTSYVMSKSPRPGHRLVRIEVVDLNSSTSDSECVVLKAQYVVTHPVDEIIDMTENLVKKITKTMCSS